MSAFKYTACKFTQSIPLTYREPKLELKTLNTQAPSDGTSKINVIATLSTYKNTAVVGAEVKFSTSAGVITESVNTNADGQAIVELTFQPENVILRVCDQGVGINTKTEELLERGWGLEGMRERVESIEGQLNIFSPETGGTIVEVKVPVDSSTRITSEEVLDGKNPLDVS